jgi:tetratricopeptide (TPR) repeat protein
MTVKVPRMLFIMCFTAFFAASCNNSELKVSSNPSQNPDPMQMKDPSLALDNPESYELALKTDSLNTSIRLRLAGQYYLNKNYDKALYHYLVVNSIDNKNLAALFNLGNVYYDTQQDQLAIKYYEKYLELDKSNSNVRCDLATCYLNLKNTNKAISLLRENIKINNNHPQSHYNLSVILKQAGKTAEADEEMKIYNSQASVQTKQNQ